MWKYNIYIYTQNLKRGSGYRCVWARSSGHVHLPWRKQHHSQPWVLFHTPTESNTHSATLGGAVGCTHMFFSGACTHTCRTDVYSTPVLPRSAAGVESRGRAGTGHCTVWERCNRLEMQNKCGGRKKDGYKGEWEILSFLCPLLRLWMLLMLTNANVSKRWTSHLNEHMLFRTRRLWIISSFLRSHF